MGILNIFIATILAVFMNLDRSAGSNIMLSRPLVTGIAIGYVLNSFEVGVYLGIWAELLWLSSLPLGGNIQPNGGLAVSTVLISWALLKCSSNILVAENFNASLVLIFLLVPIIARSYTIIEKLNRKASEKRRRYSAIMLRRNKNIDVFKQNLQGILYTFIFTFLLMFLVTPFSSFIIYLGLKNLPMHFFNYLNLAFAYIPIFALSVIACSLPNKAMPLYGLGLVAGLVFITVI